MEILGLAVIFIALVGIVGVIQTSKAPKMPPFPPAPTKKLRPEEERTLIKSVLSQSDRKSHDLVIFWVDTLAFLTYAERKSLEQQGSIVSLTPHEVLLEDVNTHRKVAVRRSGDPAAPRFAS